MVKKTTKQFIEEAKLKHGSKYDYSKVEYKNAFTKVEIICPEHGSFMQVTYSHLQGHNCPTCMDNQSNTEEFIEKAKIKHGSKYDYSKVEYKNAETKIEIICPDHGLFLQIPGNHLQGNGCPKCIGMYKTTEEWIIEAKIKHGDKYDYSKTEYINVSTKVEILC